MKIKTRTNAVIATTKERIAATIPIQYETGSFLLVVEPKAAIAKMIPAAGKTIAKIKANIAKVRDLFFLPYV